MRTGGGGGCGGGGVNSVRGSGCDFSYGFSFCSVLVLVEKDMIILLVVVVILMVVMVKMLTVVMMMGVVVVMEEVVVTTLFENSITEFLKMKTKHAEAVDCKVDKREGNAINTSN